MQIAIISLPDSQNLQETRLAVEHAGMVPVIKNDLKLANYEGYILLDGNTFQERDLLIEILKQQSALNKPILGISEGAELLVKSGLVPGVENDKPALSISSMQENENFMRLSDNYQYNAFTRVLSPNVILNISSAKHLIIPPALNLEMEENGLNVFRYCDAKGKTIHNRIAAVSNKAGNVMAIMSALEYNTMTDMIFNSMKQYISVGYKQCVKPLYYYPR